MPLQPKSINHYVYHTPEYFTTAQLREICHAHWQLLALQTAGCGQLVVAVLLVVGVPGAAWSRNNHVFEIAAAATTINSTTTTTTTTTMTNTTQEACVLWARDGIP